MGALHHHERTLPAAYDLEILWVDLHLMVSTGGVACLVLYISHSRIVVLSHKLNPLKPYAGR